MLTNPAQIRNEGNLPDKVSDAIINVHIEKASIEIRRILGDTLYQQIEGERDSQTQRYKECSKAEALLTLSYLVFALNIETTGTGIVKVKGFGETRSELLDIRDVETLSERFRNEAMKILSAYIPNETDMLKGSIKAVSI